MSKYTIAGPLLYFMGNVKQLDKTYTKSIGYFERTITTSQNSNVVYNFLFSERTETMSSKTIVKSSIT